MRIVSGGIRNGFKFEGDVTIVKKYLMLGGFRYKAIA